MSTLAYMVRVGSGIGFLEILIIAAVLFVTLSVIGLIVFVAVTAAQKSE